MANSDCHSGDIVIVSNGCYYFIQLIEFSLIFKKYKGCCPSSLCAELNTLGLSHHQDQSRKIWCVSKTIPEPIQGVNNLMLNLICAVSLLFQ